MKWPFYLAASLFALSAPFRSTQDAAPQQVRVQVISGGPTCSGCRIQRYRLAAINDSLFPGGATLNSSSNVHSTGDGRFFVANGVGFSELYLTDQHGRIVRRIGRPGAGPGEYRGPWPVLALEDRFMVFDQFARRVTSLDRHDFAVRSTARLPLFPLGAAAAVPFANGSYIVSGFLRGPSSGGFPFHYVTVGGTVSRSFGTPMDTTPPRRGLLLQRHLAPAGNGAFWAAYPDRYRVEKWDTAGRLLQVLERRAAWYEPPDSAQLRQGGPTPVGSWSLAHLRGDEQGLLWVALWVKRAARPDSVALGQPYSANYDTVIEVLDPARGTVIATASVRGTLLHPVTGSFLFSTYRETPSLEPVIDVWAFRLAQP